MNCIICGRKAEVTRMLGEVEAAFCHAHFPGEAVRGNASACQVIITKRILSASGYVESVEKIMLMEV